MFFPIRLFTSKERWIRVFYTGVRGGRGKRERDETGRLICWDPVVLNLYQCGLIEYKISEVTQILSLDNDRMILIWPEVERIGYLKIRAKGDLTSRSESNFELL